MSTVSYARRGLERHSLSIDDIFSPAETRNNCAVFGGNEDERVAVMLRIIHRSINRVGVIILHDSPSFERALGHNYYPLTTISIGQHSYDPLIGVDRNDASITRVTLQRAIASKKMAAMRIPYNDQALQRMVASEITGITYSTNPFLLVLFGIKQTERDPFINLAIGDHNGVFNSAIAGSTASHTVSHENIPVLLQNYDEVLFLPTEDLQEAQHISNCFGSYIRTYSQPSKYQHGRWPFKHSGTSLSIQQIPTSNINPQSMHTKSLVCGAAFREPILVKQVLL